MTNPAHRIAQGNPILGLKYCNVDGKTSPPKPDPQAAIASAKALLFWKYVPVTATAGMKTRPIPKPMQTPCVSIICQYSFDKLARNAPNVASVHPTAAVSRAKPASVSRPESVQHAKTRKTWIEPIQEIWEDGRPRVVV